MFIFPLDQTLGHHDSAQPVISAATAQSITPLMFHQILIKHAALVFHIHQQCLIFFFF